MSYMAFEDLAPSNFPISSSNSLLLTLTILAIFLFLKEANFFSHFSILCSLIPLPRVLFSQLFMWLAFFSPFNLRTNVMSSERSFLRILFTAVTPLPNTQPCPFILYPTMCNYIFVLLLGYFLIIYLEYKVSESRDIIFHAVGIWSTLTTRSSAL